MERIYPGTIPQGLPGVIPYHAMEGRPQPEYGQECSATRLPHGFGGARQGSLIQNEGVCPLLRRRVAHLCQLKRYHHHRDSYCDELHHGGIHRS